MVYCKQDIEQQNRVTEEGDKGRLEQLHRVEGRK